MAKEVKQMSKEAKDSLKLKFWKQERMAHKPKNRSSKHIRFYRYGREIYRCVSGKTLEAWANAGNFSAGQELSRRAKKRDKRESKAA